MELEMYCEYKKLEIRNSKSGDKVFYYLTALQNGKELHLCIFDDKAFECAVDRIQQLPIGSKLKLVCNYNYRNNKANLFIVSVNLWTHN